MTEHLTTLVKMVLAVALSAVVVPPVAGAVAAATLLRAPLPGELPDVRPSFEAVPSEVLDRNGRPIGLFRGFDRTVAIDPDDLPEVLTEAVVAIEDQRFYEHDGIDFEGVARAARVNLELGEIAQGGSTITQQYIKQAYLSGDRTFERKFREALLATELEQQLSKDEILFRYLETSYFGSGAYGVGAAAELYFNKRVDELDLSEAATIAGVLQAPGRLSPRVDLEASDARRRLVLQAMLDQGRITEAEHARAAARQLWLAENPNPPAGTLTVVAAPPPNGATDHDFFVDWIEQELVDRLGPDLVYQGGLTIHTTIDPRVQESAEAAAAARLANTEYPVEMAIVTLDHRTGEVLAMVGGRDHDVSQVNLAIGGSTGFQPGSSFKPIVLAEAFRQGQGPDTLYPAPATWAVPGCSGSRCTIGNYDGKGRGDITLRDAMRASVNTVFAQLVVDVSISETVDLARQLGLERMDPDASYGPSVALGAAESSPLSMASAFGTFANSGVRVEPRGLSHVVDPEGNVLLDFRATAGERVISAAVADNVTDVLVDVVVDGTGGRAAVTGHNVAGKTGTTQNNRAAWFVGYSPALTTAVWMGHADALASLYNINGVGQVTGGSHPAIAFSQTMSAALEGIAPEPFPEPAEIEQPLESAAEVTDRVQEGTVVSGRRPRPSVAANCGGGPCVRSAVSVPPLVPPQATTTAPPTTTPPSTTPPSTTPSTRPSPSTTARPTATAPPATTGSSTTVPAGGTP